VGVFAFCGRKRARAGEQGGGAGGGDRDGCDSCDYREREAEENLAGLFGLGENEWTVARTALAALDHNHAGGADDRIRDTGDEQRSFSSKVRHRESASNVWQRLGSFRRADGGVHSMPDLTGD
jgi:hypothetical protein